MTIYDYIHDDNSNADEDVIFMSHLIMRTKANIEAIHSSQRSKMHFFIYHHHHDSHDYVLDDHDVSHIYMNV